MNSFLNYKDKNFQKSSRVILQIKTNTEMKSLEKKAPLIEYKQKKISGRPIRLNLDELISKFREYLVSKENLLANPDLLFNRRLMIEATGDKTHWFWVAKHLPRRIEGLNNCWYGKDNSIVEFLLERTGWFDKKEANMMSYKIAFLAEEKRKKKLSEKAKKRMADENKRSELREKVKEKWKDEEYRNRVLKGIFLEKIKRRKQKFYKLKKYRPNIVDKELYRNYLKMNYEKISQLFKDIKNPLVRLDEDYKELIALDKNCLFEEYTTLEEGIGLYILYSQKSKRPISFDLLRKKNKGLTNLLKKLYFSEEVILRKIIKIRKDFFEIVKK